MTNASNDSNEIDSVYRAVILTRAIGKVRLLHAMNDKERSHHHT